MGKDHLRAFYKRMGIGFHKPNIKMWGDKDDFSSSVEKLEFILKMV